MKRVLLAMIICLGAAGLGWLAIHGFPFLKSRYEGVAAHSAELRNLGVRAIPARDVPVAALLLFGDSIIGRGFNTVRRDGNAGGHAEINTITDAMRSFGIDAFNKLDRDRLTLISTFEPCAMCKGAILEYRIRNVRYVKAKSMLHWLREDLRGISYDIGKTRIGPVGLQDSLFRMHPNYDPTRTDR
ncbi:MAG: nucleoside deaminase [Flavobacteriales bacterium]|nr:nucleoside deaminase [Flavobacteriales bacterium]